MRHNFMMAMTALLACFHILQASTSFAGWTRHGYDEFDRLKWTQYEDGTVISYDYDQVGNRTAKYTYMSVPGSFTISVTTSGNGAVFPSGVITVPSGSNQSFSIEPNAGSVLTSLLVDGVSVTGFAFYLLTAGLLISAVVGLYSGHKPETTLWGIIISLVSISFMWFLIRQKTIVGSALNSSAILADAACSRACLNLSLVLMLSSIGYEVTGIGSLDSVGAMVIAWLTFKEGRESFGKARGLACACACSRQERSLSREHQ